MVHYSGFFSADWRVWLEASRRSFAQAICVKSIWKEPEHDTGVGGSRQLALQGVAHRISLLNNLTTQWPQGRPRAMEGKESWGRSPSARKRRRPGTGEADEPDHTKTSSCQQAPTAASPWGAPAAATAATAAANDGTAHYSERRILNATACAQCRTRKVKWRVACVCVCVCACVCVDESCSAGVGSG